MLYAEQRLWIALKYLKTDAGEAKNKTQKDASAPSRGGIVTRRTKTAFTIKGALGVNRRDQGQGSGRR